MQNFHPLRVAYVLKMYPRFSETFIVNELLAHEAAGVEVTIYSLRPPLDGRFHASYAQVAAPVRYVPGDSMKHSEFWRLLNAQARVFPKLWELLHEDANLEARDIVQALWLAEQLRAAPVDCLHAHFGTVATTVARLAGLLTNTPYVFTAHAKDIFHEDVAHEDLRRKVRDAAKVITVSNFNVAHLVQEVGAPAEQVTRIYNGLDLARFPYLSPAERPPRIVAVGRLVEKKGFGDLIAACALLAQAGHPIPCEIIGGGPLLDVLAGQVAALGMEEWITLSGPQPQDSIIAAVQGAAVMAAPCVVGEDGNRDGLPTVLLEAMALGTPCISTDVTGIPELLEHNRTGLLVGRHSPAELAAALRLLVEDAALRVRLAEEARAVIEAEFDIHKNSAKIRAVYARAHAELAQPGAPALGAPVGRIS